MTSFNQEEHKIIERLQQLPMIKDRLSKEDIYQRASQQIQQPSPTKWPQRLIPILSSVAVIALLIVIIPTMFINTNQQTSDQAKDMVFESSQSDHNGLSIASDAESGTSEESLKDQAIEYSLNTLQHVVLDLADDQALVYGAVPDQQAQYLIPISQIVLEDHDYNEAIQSLYDQFQTQIWQDAINVVQGIQFEMNVDERQVIVHVPDDFSLGDGSAIPSLFEDILAFMFTPYGIDQAIFRSDAGIGVELGPYGLITEMNLVMPVANYKRYEVEAFNQTFLIPIPQDEASLEEALHDLKIRDEAFDVYETIPEEIEFTVSTTEDQVIVEFEPFKEPYFEQELMLMIESILLTAKSYGYESVSFRQLMVDQIGPYQLTEPIHVPLAANPIY